MTTMELEPLETAVEQTMEAMLKSESFSEPIKSDQNTEEVTMSMKEETAILNEDESLLKLEKLDQDYLISEPLKLSNRSSPEVNQSPSDELNDCKSDSQQSLQTVSKEVDGQDVDIKFSHTPENQDINDPASPPLGRNRRVRQKNRYFLDFHCTDLTKGARSNRDEYDGFTSSVSTRTSNRRSTTDSNKGQLDESVMVERYCRKCSNRTLHDETGGCQACLYRKIVESSKRQRSNNQRNRSGHAKQQENNNVDTTVNQKVDTTVTQKVEPIIIQKVPPAIIPKVRTPPPTATAPPTPPIVVTAAVAPVISKPNDKLVGLESWTPEEVSEYISSRGFISEAGLFKTECVDGLSLLLMQRTDFTSGLKIKLGPALKIYDLVCKMKRDYIKSIAGAV